MEKKLLDVLTGTYDNYILPFFWQHGEDDYLLTEEMERIHQSGVRAVCVESRPHEGFGTEGWFSDFDLIMREAKQRDMRVWLLDDKHFPTGYANGLIKEKYPHLRKWHIREDHTDVSGPLADAAFVANPHGGRRMDPSQFEESLLAVVAYRRDAKTGSLLPGGLDLTDRVAGDFLYWDVPEGFYRVFFIRKTRLGAGNKADYIHMIDPESVDVLIEAVYQPHYERYKAEFGQTFAGFFSDEPCFGNSAPSFLGGGPGFYEQTVGVPNVPMPWRDDILSMLQAAAGEEARLDLPGLWFDIGARTARIRTAYMDTVTRLYRECFCQKLGDWCRERGVEYIGHIIEDMNAHARLGSSAGHFFRSMDGQDMSGIDVVLHQIVPGFSQLGHASPITASEADPQFFDYALAKLGASHAHIQPRMKGRAMCEIYGAYGWAEGLPMMKWLTDHMLVRGINYFVPHAFSPEFPDPDCPPHFYARGQNPQFLDFSVLMHYTNAMSHLFTDGRHVATAAVLYHAEAEWAGGDYMFTEKPVKALYDAHIDLDIVPADTLLDGAVVEDGQLQIHEECFACLVIPYAEILGRDLLAKVQQFAEAGLPVVFVDGIPKRTVDETPVGSGLGVCSVVRLDSLASFFQENGFSDLQVEGDFPLLRCYHYVRDGAHLYMFFNEDIHHTVETVVTLPTQGRAITLDLLQGSAQYVSAPDGRLSLHLSPYQSVVVAFAEDLGSDGLVSAKPERQWTREQTLTGPFTVALATPETYPGFTPYTETDTLFNVTGPEHKPEFVGRMRYTTTFRLDSVDHSVLDLGRVGETARVWVNDELVGVRICPPYTFDISQAANAGENRLAIEVANTPVFQVKDYFSRFMALPPSGLLGPVKIMQAKEKIEG